MEYIYIISNPFETKKKIGSTKYPIDRINTYQTYCSEPWIINLILKIDKNCYEVDKLIQEKGPYTRSNIKGGGTEWYEVDDVQKLKDFFDVTNIKFEDVTNSLDFNKPLNNNNIHKEDMEKIKIEKNKFNFRYGQKEVYDNFNKILDSDKYWGAIIAPTGWGKSLVHLILMGLYLKKHKKNIILLTKRKDVLIDQLNDKDKITFLQDNNLFPHDIKILNQVDNYDFKEINKKTDNPKIIIINVDKLIDRSKSSYATEDEDAGIKIDKKKYENVEWDKIGLLIFDELHWVGATCISELIKYCKEKVDYGIGSSATPVRENDENQKKIYSLFGENEELNILHEVSYEEAWENNIIVPIEHHYFPISSFNKTKGDGKKFKYEFTDEGKKEIIENIKKIKLHYNKMIFYFHSRKSLLSWYELIEDNKLFNHKLFMSFHLDDKIKTEFKLNGKEKEIEKGIMNFKKEKENAILFVVNKATEGFDDKRVELVANLDYTKSQGIVQLIQKLGRCQRIMDDKTKGYYISPIPIDEEGDNMDYLYSILDNYLESIRSKNKMLFGKGKSKGNCDFISKYIKFNNFKKITIDEIHNKIKEKRESRVNLKKEWKTICIKLKNYYGFDNDRINFEDEYKKLYNKDIDLLDIDKPQLKKIIKDRSWYQWLEINTEHYLKTKTVWKNKCNELNITYENYQDKVRDIYYMPFAPNLFYKDFTNLPNELSRFQERRRR